MKHIPIAEATRLTDIPGVGPSLARDLEALGYRTPQSLRGQNPQAMYDQLMAQVGTHIDRCVLYVFRCAVYYAETVKPEQDKLLWWNWQDNPNKRRA